MFNQSSSSRNSHQSHRSESKFNFPIWVHCENCFTTYDADANMTLLTCGHIFCNSCLGKANCSLADQNIFCLRCEIQTGHRRLDNSLDPKLREMFYESYADPVLLINMKTINFMMTKIRNFVKFLSHRIKEKKSMPTELKEKYKSVQDMVQRNEKLRKYDDHIANKIGNLKTAAAKKLNNYKLLRSNYERQMSLRRARDTNYKTLQGNKQQDLKFISSGWNERSNPYIDQVNSPNWTNKYLIKSNNNSNGGASRSQISHRSTVMPSNNLVLNAEGIRSRQSDQSPTFRPKIRSEFPSHNQRLEPSTHGKRLIPSFQRDEYSTPPKRANLHYPVTKDSVSSDRLSFIDRELGTNLYENIQAKPLVVRKFKNPYDNSRLESTDYVSRIQKYR